MTKKAMTVIAIQVEIPKELLADMDHLVKEGWFPNREHIIEKALKKFLNSNRPELLEKFVLEDVESALHGKHRTK